jgi:hypothetical protein
VYTYEARKDIEGHRVIPCRKRPPDRRRAPAPWLGVFLDSDGRAAEKGEGRNGGGSGEGLGGGEGSRRK